MPLRTHCPHCNSDKLLFISEKKGAQCTECKRRFTQRVKVPPKTKRNELIVAMYKTRDLSVDYIAATFGISRGTVLNILARYKVQMMPTGRGSARPKDFEHVYARYYAERQHPTYC